MKIYTKLYGFTMLHLPFTDLNLGQLLLLWQYSFYLTIFVRCLKSKKGEAEIFYLIKAAFRLPTESIPIPIAPVINANDCHEPLH